MEINKINDILPQFNQAGDISTQSLRDDLDGNTMTAAVDFYENLNLITFEKSLSRLRNNYSLQLKARPLDMSDHYQ